jgi:hypothetical protein
MTNQVTMCATCGGVLMRQWWRLEHAAYDCQRCHHLTDAEGHDKGVAPRSRFPGAGVVLAVVVLIILFGYLAWMATGDFF